MAEKAGFPFTALRFAADGRLTAGPTELVPAGTTDVIVLSHGWKNDEADANALYEGILHNMRAAAGDHLGTGGRHWAAVGVYWPAFRFRPDLTLLPEGGSGAQGGASAVGDGDLPTDELRPYAAALADEFGIDDPQLFAALAVDARGGGGKADAFVERLRAALLEADGDEVRADHAALLGDPGRELVAEMRDGGSFSAAEAGAADPAEPAGGGASFQSVRERLARLRSGGAAAVARLLNQATYYEMKARAGSVGAALSRELAVRLPGGVRLHLVGHSFGGRLVTAAAAADNVPPIDSLSLLQAAYSHNGLGTGFGAGNRTAGAFRRVIEERRVAGPVLVTHTHRDSAVGFFYALASTVSGTIASSFGAERLIGGPDDLHGGMGANGTQHMKPGEAVAHVAGEAPVALVRGKVNNVLSDTIVKDHNDVANAPVGALVWQAVSTA